ncbi:MAG: hypothetical protein IKK11_05630 [Oscillospiraceae bacterium]|nr:hypothetical protein [Oscillospiraceae bacterium]
MVDKFRNLTEEEIKICEENGISAEGKTVVLNNDRGLWLLHHKTRDILHIDFGEKRTQKKAVP